MKPIHKKLLVAVGLSVCILTAVITTVDLATPPFLPVPAGHLEEEEQHLQKELWIETLHRSAPGVDWRAMDQAYKDLQYEQKLNEIKQRRSDEKSFQGTRIDTIAGGILTGTWVEKGSKNLAGRMHCVDVDFRNNLVYGASSGGQIWVGSVKGANWRTLTDHKQVLNILFLRVFPLPDGGTRIMMTTREALFYYSDDMGITWNFGNGLSSYRSGGNIVRALSKPDGTIYLLVNRSGYNFLLRSTDLGENFERLARIEGTIYSDIWSGRFAQGDVYYIDKNQFYRFDGIGTLEKLTDIALNFSTNEIEKIQMKGTHTDSTDFVYVMYNLEKRTNFFGSDNSGMTWSYRGGNTERAFMPNSFGVSHKNPKLLAFGGVNAFTSRDGGLTWLAINSWGDYYGNMKGKLHADIPEMEFFVRPDGKEIAFVCTDGGTYYSDNDLLGVENVSLTGLYVSQYYSTYTHREQTQVIYAGSQDQGFQRSNQVRDGIVEFTQTISGDYGHIVSADGGNSFWTVYPGFAMRYPEAITGTQIVTWDFTGKNHLWMPPLMEDPYNPAIVYLAGGTSSTGNHLWKLEDKGGSISVSELGFDFSDGNGNHWISAMAFSPINKDYRYVLNSGGRFFFSTNQGIDWEKSGSFGPGSHYFYGNTIVSSPKEINTLYIGGAGYSAYPVYVSTNGGKTFSPMWDGLPRTLVFEMRIDEIGSLLFAATEVGPFVCILKEQKWYDLGGASAPQQTYWSVDYIPSIKTARFGTYGRGIWDFKIQSFNLGATGIDEPIISTNDELVRIYPNPFATVLTIKPVNQEGAVTIEIYSSSGRMVFRSSQEPVDQVFEWRPMNLPAGIYLISVRQGTRQQTLRVIKNQE